MTEVNSTYITDRSVHQIDIELATLKTQYLERKRVLYDERMAAKLKAVVDDWNEKHKEYEIRLSFQSEVVFRTGIPTHVFVELANHIYTGMKD